MPDFILISYTFRHFKSIIILYHLVVYNGGENDFCNYSKPPFEGEIIQEMFVLQARIDTFFLKPRYLPFSFILIITSLSLDFLNLDFLNLLTLGYTVAD